MQGTHRYSRRFAMLAMAALALHIVPIQPIFAQDAIEADASTVLAEMSNYLGSLPRFSVDYDVGADIVSYEGQKLQFVSSGTVTVQRPDKLHASRKGAVADVELVLDGKMLSLFGNNLNAFYQVPAATIDEAIDILRNDVGFDAPGADLLVAKPLQQTETDATSGTHVGMTFFNGVKVHHLAFRGRDVDWQLWVSDGEKPLPVKYIITSKWVSASPEYSIVFRNWNTAPSIADRAFVFVPAKDAKRLETFSVDAIGDIETAEE